MAKAMANREGQSARGRIANAKGMRLERVTKSFEGVRAVNDVTLHLKPGTLLTLLGPSGCGKTTTLRCVAGLEVPDSGTIRIGDSVVFDVDKRRNLAPEDRQLGMVFQSYAVWPHMKVFDNVAYPLTVNRRGRRAEVRERVREVLRAVGLTGMEDRFATHLSGGQQQRVALARALVANPRIVLFDEPLSNLDVALRKEMRVQISKVHRTLGISALYVTHDQEEALALSDEVAVMNHGVVEQVGPAEEVFSNPRTEFVASFIGGGAPCRGSVVERSGDTRVVVRLEGPQGFHVKCRPVMGFAVGDAVSVAVRPEAISVLGEPPSLPAENVFEAEVGVVQFLGHTTEVHTEVDGWPLVVRDSRGQGMAVGSRCAFRIDDGLAVAVPSGGQEQPQKEDVPA